MSLRNFFSFGRNINKPKVAANLQIVFHQDTRGLGMHGTLIASHVDHKLSNDPVRFTFVGMHEAPPLTPEMMEFIWYKAEAAGFMVTKLASYGSVMDSVKATKMSDVLSQDRIAAESRFPTPSAQQLPPHVAAAYGRTLGQMAVSAMAEDATNQPQQEQHFSVMQPMAPGAPTLPSTKAHENKTPVMA